MIFDIKTKEIFIFTEVHVKIHPSPQNTNASNTPNTYNNWIPSIAIQ